MVNSIDIPVLMLPASAAALFDSETEVSFEGSQSVVAWGGSVVKASTARRAPPRHLKSFDENIETKHFVSGADYEVVKKIFHRNYRFCIKGAKQLDFADLLWRACEKFDSLPHVMNAGVGRDYSVKDYYEIVASVVGYGGQFDFDLSQPTGMAQKLTSCELASNWGWDAQVKLADGIAQTYRYFKGVEPCKP